MRSTPAELIDTMLALVPDAAVVVDEHGTITHGNDALADLFGHAPDSLIGQPIEVLVPERLRSVHRRHRATFAEDPRTRAMGVGLRLWGRRLDGSEFPVDISLAPLELDGARSTVASIRDVSDRAEAEATRAQLAAIVEGSADAIFALGLDGVIASWNPGAQRALGHRADQVIGHHVSRLLVDGRSTDFEDQLGAALEGSTIEARDMDLATSAGGVLPVAVVVSPLRTDGQEVTGFSVVARDITERRRAEAELDRTKHERDLLLIGDERGRIARDLHDVVIQRLFASGLSVQSIMPMVRDEVAAARLADVVDELDSTIRDIRTTIFTLAPPTGSSSGLRAQVLELVDDSSRSLGFEPTTRFWGPVDTTTGPTQTASVLAVIREALANVARHARAGSAEVEVAATDRLEVVVVDDGVGIADDRRESGLRNLRERAEELGGSLEVAPGRPSGTVLTWQIPIVADDRP